MKNRVSFIIFKQLLLVIALFFISSSIAAQDFIDEDFLDNLETNAKPLWNESSAVFANNVAPAKWNNESAVVLGYKRSISFDKQSRGGFITARQSNVFFFEKVRFKIKLQDKNSVKEFSQVYFRYSEKQDGFSTHVIKADGTVQQVDLKNAVSIESASEVPEFFKSFFDQNYATRKRYYKVAIPGLEPGDVLEYVANTKSSLNVTMWGLVEFDPQYEVCSKPYPVMHNEIVIETDSKSFFKSLSLNGAPEFKKEASDDAEFYRYVFVDKDRGTEKDVNFVNSLLVYPLVKFQVIYANSDKAKGALIGERGELKTGFTKEELARKAWENYERTGNQQYGNNPFTIQQMVSQSWAELKKMDAKDWSEDQFITKVYYYVRNKVVYSDAYLSDKVFAYIFGSLLYQRDIPSELIITMSNAIGPLNQVLFDGEIRYVIRVKDKLYFNCTDHSNPGELVTGLLANDAYIIAEPTKKGQDIQPYTLPNTAFQNNASKYSIQVSMDTGFNNLVVSRTSNYTGLSKADNIGDAMKYTPYIFDDYRSYGGTSPTDKMKDKVAEDYYTSVKALKDEFAEAKPELVKNNLQKEFGQKVEYKNFKITSDGRTQKKSDLIFIEDFELTGNVRKAGKKYLVNLPGLVGSQLQIKEKERDRKYDISMRYPRTLTWDIKFNIPNGYTADGLKELNQNVENEAGKYSCEATEENGVVTLKITKIYKQANISKSQWKSVLAFVDAAYNNSTKYILLKPKS